MILSDRDIAARLFRFSDLGLNISPLDAAELTKKGQIPGELRQVLEQGKIIIDPFIESYNYDQVLGPASIDLTLGCNLRIPSHSASKYIDLGGYIQNVIIDFSKPETLKDELDESVELKDCSKYILKPNEFIQGITQEIIMMPTDLMGRVMGRSRFGRFGLTATVDAPKIDPGFLGHIVLEIVNQGERPFALYKSLPICQITFETLSSPCLKPYYEQRDRRFLGQPSAFGDFHEDEEK